MPLLLSTMTLPARRSARPPARDHRPRRPRRHAVGARALLLAAVPFDLAAQATLKDDGQWRAAVGLAVSASSGNTRSTSFSTRADAVRATPEDKWSLFANALSATADGRRTADQWRAGTKYDWNLGPRAYSFGSLELERDKVARLDSRSTVGAGAGWRFVKTERHDFEVFGGAAWVRDAYAEAREVDGVVRRRYGYPSLLLGEESSHKLGESSTLKQRLVITPKLDNGGQFRAQWDSGFAVAVAPRLSLTVGLSVKHNSEPGGGVRRTDAVFTTGLGLKFE